MIRAHEGDVIDPAYPIILCYFNYHWKSIKRGYLVGGNAQKSAKTLKLNVINTLYTDHERLTEEGH